MEQKNNFNRQMEKAMENIPAGESLLLHSCCGPCSSAVLERLAKHFKVTILYYNPNIWPAGEYARRKDEQKRLLALQPMQYPVEFVEGAWEHDSFLRAAKGLEAEPEGGARCAACFALRLQQSARWAAEQGFAWFTTTLSVSPHKNAALLNALGQQAAQKHNISFLCADFKKKDGYKRSIELSKEYGLYRQDYCGCEFSAASSGDTE